jgi:hypothetical protein
MRKHIFGFALFALIISSAIFVYQLIYRSTAVNVARQPRNEITSYEPSMPVIKPAGFAEDIYTINAASVVVDVNSKKVYAGIDDAVSNPSPDEFVKVVIFDEDSEKVAYETRWINYLKSSNLVFRCDECASMTSKKNYYARVYLASAPDDANLKLRLENEKSGDFYLQATAVLVSSGKNK